MRTAVHPFVSGLILALVSARAAKAQDWPQWRGPDRTGAVAGGVRLFEAIPATGLPLLWRSEPIPDTGNASQEGSDVGHSTPVAAGGRVYLYLNRKVKDESPLRLPWGVLDRLGCFQTPLPADLAAKMEAARTSPQRAALSIEQVPAWAGDWVARNLSHAQYVALAASIEDRLIRGPAALGLATLEKLTALKGKPYADEEALEKALGTTGLETKRIASVVEELTSRRMCAVDVLFCFDAATGKTLWKMERPGAMFEYGTSSTPCIVGGDSSPVVAGDFLVAAQGGITRCYRLAAERPREMWKLDYGIPPSTPVIFRDHLYGIQSQSGPLFCVELATGKTQWATPEGENYGATGFNTASCVVADGKVFIDGHPDQLSIVRAAPGRFELLGKAKVAAGNLRAATPTIADGRLFLRAKDALVCYDLRAKPAP